MLSDDRPTDPAWLPIFSKKEHFMGNAFGMIPGLETDEWSNDACRGYVIMAMEDCGFSKKDIMMLCFLSSYCLQQAPDHINSIWTTCRLNVLSYLELTLRTPAGTP